MRGKNISVFYKHYKLSFNFHRKEIPYSLETYGKTFYQEKKMYLSDLFDYGKCHSPFPYIDTDRHIRFSKYGLGFFYFFFSLE